MLCDLHIHSCFATGNQTPEAIVEEAVSKNIGLVSITDDDTMDAYRDLPEIAARHHVSFILGIQVSASYRGHFFRLLAYDCDPENLPLRNLLEENRRVWDDFGGQVVIILSKDHPELSVEEYSNSSKDPKLGGFKYNSYFFQKGMDGSYEAGLKRFKQYQEEMTGAMKFLRFRPVEEVIEIIHDAGGRAIIPGGYLRNAETLATDIENSVRMGIDGLECFSPNYSEEMTQMARRCAEKHALLITGGGDGHGTWAKPETFAIGVPEIDDKELKLGTIRVFD